MKKDIDTLIWLPPTQLNANHSVYDTVDDRVGTLFIWDDAYFSSMGFSTKRLYFIWQCLQDFRKQNLMVIKGDTDHVLKSIYERTPNIKIVTPDDKRLDYSNWDFIKRIPQSQFFIYQGKMPFGFFKFWKQAEQTLYPNVKKDENISKSILANKLTQKNKHNSMQSA